VTSSERPDPELGEIEWLDVDPSDRPDPAAGPRPPGPPGLSSRGWYLLVFVALVAVVLVLAVGRHTSHKAAPSPTSSASPSPSTSPSRSPTELTTSPAASASPPVAVTDVGHPLLDVPTGVELFARTADSVLRLQLAAGRITRTTGIDLGTTGPVFFLVGPHEAAVKPLDAVPGYLVRDGQPVRPLQGLLTNDGQALPGPGPGQVWVWNGGQNPTKMVLVDFAGRPVGVTISAEGEPTSDGAGYLMTYLSGGVYDARPGSLRRITSGELLAIGRTRWLTEECDDQHRCTLDVIDRSTGRHRVLGPTSDRNDPPGVISPDGTTAALLRSDNQSQTAVLHLFDLESGADRSTRIVMSRDEVYEGPPAVWTPDSRWLIVVDATGRIVAVDRGGHPRTLTDGDPQVAQIALRSTP
jgi:hypothetical protein